VAVAFIALARICTPNSAEPQTVENMCTTLASGAKGSVLSTCAGVGEGFAVDKATAIEAIDAGALRLGLTLPAQTAGALWDYASELLRWNMRVNLTAITEPSEVVEKHLLDSLAVLPELVGSTQLLDLGAGGGLPSIPLALALPRLGVTLVDAVQKKVGFLKHAAARLGLAPRVRAVHLRALGNPQREGLALADTVIARAFMEVGEFTRLAKPYLQPRGRVVALLGRAPSELALRAMAEAEGLMLERFRAYTLPWSGDPRAVVVLRKG
jgi:16S rRNA (guanine527-N7)-methyltransferase